MHVVFIFVRQGNTGFCWIIKHIKQAEDHRPVLHITYILLWFQSAVWLLLLSLSADTFVCFFFLYAGGPGVHDPCERDPTDVLSDLSPQQADIVTESAQVSHRLLSSSSSSASPAESAVSFCIRSISDMTPQDSSVSQCEGGTLAVPFVHIYCPRKTV